MSTTNDNRKVDFLNFLISIAGMLQFKQDCFLILLESQSGQSFTVAGGKNNGLAFLFYKRSAGADLSTPGNTNQPSSNVVVEWERKTVEGDKWGETCTFFNHVFPHVCTLPFLTGLKPLTS